MREKRINLNLVRMHRVGSMHNMEMLEVNDVFKDIRELGAYS